MECKLDEYQNEFIELLENFSNIINYWNNAANSYQIAIDKLQEIYNYLIHYHKSHLHYLMHSPDILNTKYGISNTSLDVNPLDRLVREISTEYDTNDDNLIFGRDFIFSGDDPNLPLNIRNTSIQQEVRYGMYPDNFKTFKEYLNSFNLRQRCTPSTNNSPIKKLVLQAVLGENPDNPKSQFFEKDKGDTPKLCYKEVYGKTFIIDPNDPDKPNELIEIEKNIEIPKNIKLWKYSDYLKKCSASTSNKDNKNIADNKKEQELCDYVCTRLVGEWLRSTDIDHNGLIYGIDFMLSDYEPKKCRCLKELEIDLEWNPPKDIRIIYWEDFCNTFPDKNPDDRYKKKINE